jgi:hypothetical protein
MNINKKNIDKEKDEDFKESFPMYSLEVITDLILGAVLGVIVNTMADYIGNLFKLPFWGVLVVQLFLISVFLYVMKIDSKYLYNSWKGQTSYGIVFTSVFLAVQKNMLRFFENIYLDEKNFNLF